MKQTTYQASTLAELDQALAQAKDSGALGSPQHTLVLAHETRSGLSAVDEDLRALRDALPGYQVVGATMLGPTMMGADASSLEVREGLELSILSFDTSTLTTLRYDCGAMSPLVAGRLFAQDLAEIPDARAVLLLCAGAYLSVDAFLGQMSPEAGGVPLFGTQAGVWDSRDVRPQRVFVDGQAHQDMIVAVVLRGQDLHVQVGASFGWHPVGKRMRVTSGTDGGYVATIDHLRPSELYERYLHMDVSKADYADCCAFPIVFPDGPERNARVPRQDEDGCFYYGSTSPVGLAASLAYARERDLLRASLDLAQDLAPFQPQALWGVFCPNRRIFLGNDLADREIGYFRQVCPSLVTASGFCEIYHHDGHGISRNSTAVLAALREGDAAGPSAKVDDPEIDRAASPNVHLAGLLVSLLEESTRDLEKAASIDGMTGLPNRTALERWVKDVSQQALPGTGLTAALFDIDNFKGINDSQGHDMGDQVLCRISSIMGRYLDKKTVVGRWGGDEFLVVSVSLDEGGMSRLLDDISAHLRGVSFKGVDHVTLSAGISRMDAREGSFRELFKRIDRAMYRSKHAGGDQATVYTDALEGEISFSDSTQHQGSSVLASYERSSLPLLIVRTSKGGRRTLLVSDGYCHMTHTPRQKVLDYLLGGSLDHIHPTDRPKVRDFLEDRGATVGPRTTLLYRLSVRGSYHRILASSYSQRIAGGDRLALIHFVDLTTDASRGVPGHHEETSDNHDASTSDEQGRGSASGPYQFGPVSRQALESLRFPLGVMQRVHDGYQAILVSDGACRLFGEAREDLVRYLSNRSYRKMHPDDAGRLIQAARHFKDRPDQSVVCRLMVDDSYHPVLFDQRRHIMDDGTELFFITYTDLEETGAVARQDLDDYYGGQGERLLKDDLTGLPNDAYFRQFAPGLVRELFDRGLRPAVLFFNVRDMRSYNDRYGYARGNDLLRKASQVIQGAFDPMDLVIRQSDDHFVVVTGTYDVGDRVLKASKELEALEGSGSARLVAGICWPEDPSEAPTSAVDKARMAVNFIDDDPQATFCVYDERVKSHYRIRDYVLSHWEQAIREGWVEVYYQPILDIMGGTVAGVEALARWNDPERGMISPAVFVPILEERRLMWELDLHILRLASAYLGKRKREGLDCVPFSVNLSRNDLMVPNLHEQIEQVIAQNGLRPSDVSIEITETALLDNEKIIHDHLRRFHEVGHLVFLDDFGSGYSSFNTLQEFDFDVLKIDMMFLRAANEKTPIILTDIVDMAKRLGMTTLMEGVESKSELALLREMGCTLAQGYLISMPQPAPVLGKALAARQIELADPKTRRFYEETSRVNVLDASTLEQGQVSTPLRDKSPVFILAQMGEGASARIEVIYENAEASRTELSSGRRSSQDLERALAREGVLRTVVTGGMAEALETGREARRDLVMDTIKSRLSIRLIAQSGDMSSYLVVCHDIYLPQSPHPNQAAAAFWAQRG